MSKNNARIVVPMSESDLQELLSGQAFNWTFTADNGVDIDVCVRLETDEDNQ